jgi:hypothetical protein
MGPAQQRRLAGILLAARELELELEKHDDRVIPPLQKN